jgi:glycosyltransferase involved in cell wall biosynthesis
MTEKTKMTDKPLLTIICTTYNHAAFIRDALESFIMQKTDFAFEVIVADDCSTDGTQKIILEYAERYPEIIKPVLREKNIGAVQNFIQSGAMVKTRYAIINEGDDYFTSPLKLQKQVDFLEANPEYALCFHPVKVIYHDLPDKQRIFPSDEHRFNKTTLTINDLLTHNFIQTNSCLYRWRFVNENIAEFIPVDILPGDYYIHLLHAQKGNIFFMDECMSVYRIHSGGLWYNTLNDIDAHYLKNGALEMEFFFQVYKNFTNCSADYFEKTVLYMFTIYAGAYSKNNAREALAKLCARYPELSCLYILKCEKQKIECEKQKTGQIVLNYGSLSWRFFKIIHFVYGSFRVVFRRLAGFLRLF